MENTLNLDFDSILKSVNPDAVVEQKEEVTMENMVIEGQEAEEKEEQQQEEEVKPVVEVKEEDKPVEPQTTTNNFASLAKTLLENGKWQDGVIVDKDGNEVALSEMESLDEETFLQIQENQDQEQQDQQDQKDKVKAVLPPTSVFTRNRNRCVVSSCLRAADGSLIF